MQGETTRLMPFQLIFFFDATQWPSPLCGCFPSTDAVVSTTPGPVCRSKYEVYLDGHSIRTIVARPGMDPSPIRGGDLVLVLFVPTAEYPAMAVTAATAA